MALIKSTTATSLLRDAVVLDLGDLQRQGQEIVRRARAEAERIVADAREERHHILLGAREAGRAEGLAAGLEEGKRQGFEMAAQTALADRARDFQALEAAWRAALDGFQARRDDLLQSATTDVLALALEIARKVVKRAVDVDPSVIGGQLAAALAVVTRPTEVVIAINPADRDAAARALPGLLAGGTVIRHAEFVDDPAIARGGCVVRTRAESSPDGRGGRDGGGGGGGVIDASIPTQLDRLIGALLPGAPTTDELARAAIDSAITPDDDGATQPPPRRSTPAAPSDATNTPHPAPHAPRSPEDPPAPPGDHSW